MRYLLILIVFITPFLGFGQDPLPKMRTFTPKDYGENQTPENWSITQDSAGIMYFGNAGGVLSYDHEHWEFIPVRKGQFIFSLCADPSSDIVYTGGEGEFGMLTHSDHGRTNYISLSETAEIDFNFGRIWRIYSTQNLVFFQSYEAVFVYNKTSMELTTITATSSFHLLLKCEDDIYVRERGFGLKKWIGKSFELINQGEKFEMYAAFDIVPYKKDEPIIVTQELGLLVLGKDSIYALSEDSTANLRYQHIIGGLQAEEGTYFLNSLKQGVYEINQKGQITNRFSAESGLKSQEIKAMYIGNHGNLWLATGNGISVINRSIPLSFYSNSVGLEGNIQCIKEFRGSLLVGTSVGLYQQIGGRHRFEQLELDEQVWDLDVVNEDLIIATNNGLFLFDGELLELVQNVNSEEVYYDSANQTLLVSGANGIVILDVINQYSVMQAFGIPLGKSMGIIKDPQSESIWLGTTQSGIFKLDFDGFEYTFENFGEENGLAAGEWIKPVLYGGKLKFGTASELLEYNPAENSEDGSLLKGFFSEYSDHPFQTGVTFQNFDQHDNTIWYCVDNQIGKLTGNDVSEYPFQSLDIGRINFLIADSVLWIGGAEGLIQYRFNSSGRVDSPHLLIRSISFKDSAYYSGVGVIEIEDVPYSQNDLEVVLAIVSNSISDKMTYRYSFDESDWSEWSDDPVIKLHNLSFGAHTIKIIGQDQFGIPTHEHSFEFQIISPWYVTWWAIIIYIVALFALVIFAVYIGRRRLRKQNIWLEGVVKERTAELEESYHQIMEQKEEITDSINYAKRIQEAILPRPEDIKKSLKEYFVLFKPKDIVSGDFYWFADTGQEQIFVCADCTGHGVPGGFMSMIGSDKLNRKIIEEGYHSPSDILRELNLGIKSSLKQSGDDIESTKDGMDAAIVNISGMTLKYAGANRPLWIIRNGEFIETKATKSAVAGFTPDDQHYLQHDIELLPGDAIYMSTDGYPDQFGGIKGKKFKMKQMRETLLAIVDMPMEKQRQHLDQLIEEWMGELEQIDDICIVGIRV